MSTTGDGLLWEVAENDEKLAGSEFVDDEKWNVEISKTAKKIE